MYITATGMVCSVGLNPCGSHSPPLAALIARVSETDVLLTTGRRLAHLYNTPPLGAGILY